MRAFDPNITGVKVKDVNSSTIQYGLSSSSDVSNEDEEDEDDEPGLCSVYVYMLLQCLQ